MAVAHERVTIPPRESDRFPQAIHEEATQLAIADLVRSLRKDLGASLLAVMVDVPAARIVDEWARGKATPTPVQERRLRAGYEVVRTLRAWEAADTIRAWFVGMNPLLGDTSPALMLAKDPAAVLEAAHGLIAM